MGKRTVIVFARTNRIENLVREISDLIVYHGGEILYKKVSEKPLFIYGGDVHGERI